MTKLREFIKFISDNDGIGNKQSLIQQANAHFNLIKDRYKFLNTPIVICEFDEPENRKDIYEYFVKLNTTGKPIEKGHLEKILKMIEDKN